MARGHRETSGEKSRQHGLTVKVPVEPFVLPHNIAGRLDETTQSLGSRNRDCRGAFPCHIVPWLKRMFVYSLLRNNYAKFSLAIRYSVLVSDDEVVYLGLHIAKAGLVIRLSLTFNQLNVKHIDGWARDVGGRHGL